MLGQMRTTAEREQHDLVAEALESRAEAGLPLPSLPVGSLPAEEWVAFGKVTQAMEKVDLEARKVRNARRLYQDERPQEVESAC